MMNKIYLIFIVLMAALAIWGTEKALADTTIIVSPDGTTTICTVKKNVVICS